MAKDINEKFKDKNLGRIFYLILTALGYKKKAHAEQVASIAGAPPLSSDYIRKVYKDSNKGWEDEYVFKASKMSAVLFTSWLEAKNGLRDIDRIWPLLRRVKPRVQNEKPFHLQPLNRTQSVEKTVEKVGLLCREVSKHWPCCKECGDALYWNFVPVETAEERYMYWRDRMLFCDNPDCALYNKNIGLRASTVAFPDETITASFQKPFKDDIARRKREWAKGIIRKPKNYTRALTLKGISKKPSVSEKKALMKYNDETSYLDDGLYHD